MGSSRAVITSIFKRSSVDGWAIEMFSDFIENGGSSDFVIIYGSVFKKIGLVVVFGEIEFEQCRVEEDNVHDFMDECVQI
jgi:hypothetical protein